MNVQRARASAVVALALAALGAASPASADIVTEWNAVGLETVRATGTPPPATGRAMAMVHTAMFDAINGISGGYGQYAAPIAGAGVSGNASAAAAGARAARDVLASLYPARAAQFDATLAGQLAAIPDGPAKDAGIAYGQSVASVIVARRANDGSAAAPAYTPSGEVGRWTQTPGGPANPLFQQYATVDCWAMTTAAQFRPGPPPSVDSEAYAQAYDEVRRFGSANSLERTPEQTDIARLWAAGAGTITPPGMWNVIARDIGAARGQSLEENARMMALLNIALADAAVCAWDAKVVYDYWRPITGIRAGETDGNPLTAGDAAWLPLLATPGFQSYTSGHSTFSSAGASVLAGFFGTDLIAFSVSGDDVPITRSFTSLRAAAEEAGQSRIYGGIHWQFDNGPALQAGAALGQFVHEQFLTVPGTGGAGLIGFAGLLALRRRR